jgi:hypothetical protein
MLFFLLVGCGVSYDLLFVVGMAVQNGIILGLLSPIFKTDKGISAWPARCSHFTEMVSLGRRRFVRSGPIILRGSQIHDSISDES